MFTKSYDIFCITETWLNDMICDSEILPYNYAIHRKDRNTRGDGILVAIKNNIPSILIYKHQSIEFIVVELHASPNLKIVCTYIPPNCNDEYQQEVLSSINSLNTECDTILLGDFNCPGINWSTLSATTPFSLSLCNLLYSKNLVNQPTHFQGNTLDLILILLIDYKTFKSYRQGHPSNQITSLLQLPYSDFHIVLKCQQ